MRVLRILFVLIVSLSLTGNVPTVSLAQDGSGATGDSSGGWLTEAEYRRRFGGEWLTETEYRRRFGGEWLTEEEYRRRFGGDWIPVEPTPDFWDEFWRRFNGSRSVYTGVRLVQWGVSTTVVVLADDWTVVGVSNDPLVLVTGGVAIVGGVILVGNGVYTILETWYDR